MLEALLSPGEARFGASRGAVVDMIGSQTQFSFLPMSGLPSGRFRDACRSESVRQCGPESVQILGGPMHTELESPVAGHCREIGSGTLSLTVTHGSSGTSGN